MTDRPMNILLITSDQQRWDTLGIYNPHIRTPNLDALARAGIAYDRAYTPNPTCTPARVSILTGEFPSRHGCYTIGTSLPEEYPTIPQQLHEAGYFTGLIGKAHFQRCSNAPTDAPGTMESPPKIFDLDFFADWTGPYYGFEYAKLAIAHGTQRETASMHYGQWLRDQGVDPECYFGGRSYDDFGTWDLPEEYHYTTWTAEETITALDQAGRQNKPFFLWSSFQDPHNPCFVPEPWASMYDPDEMPKYSLREGEFADKPPFYQGSQQGGPLGHPELDGEKNWYCFRGLPQMDEEKTRKLTAIYYGMVSMMDHHIGRIIEALKQRGLWDHTIVIFTTDHGDYLGNHGLWWKGLPTYEDAQRLPFLVRHPNVKTPGAHSSAFQNLVDIGPSILAAGGVAPRAGLQGADQTPAWIDAAAQVRDWTMVEYRPTESAFMQKTFLHDIPGTATEGKEGTHCFKIVLYHDLNYGELYDLSVDPEQYRNLWDDPAYQEVRVGLMRKFISAEMEKDGVLRPRPAWA
jgi:uncharacterized sulfatase